VIPPNANIVFDVARRPDRTSDTAPATHDYGPRAQSMGLTPSAAPATTPPYATAAKQELLDIRAAASCRRDMMPERKADDDVRYYYYFCNL